jgi:hypothetical protein
MNILIVGDSWSKPDGYTEPSIYPYSNQNCLPLEYYLLSQGHTVYNRGEGGRGNLNSLKIADYFLKMAPHVNINIDLVIFFNTDLSRDRTTVFHNQEYPKGLDNVTKQIYNKNIDTFKKINQYYKGKWAVIGGCAPLMNPDDYDFAEFKIIDWRSEILGYQVEGAQWLFDYPFLSTTIDHLGLDSVEYEADKIENVWKHTQDRPDLFPDGSHPNMQLQQELGMRIHNHFTRS